MSPRRAPRSPIDEVRRLVARLGASGTAHAAPALDAVARAPEHRPPAVGAPALAPEAPARAAEPLTARAHGAPGAGLATTARSGDPSLPAPSARDVRTALRVAAGGAGPVARAAPRRAAPLAAPRVRAVPAGGEGTPLRTVRRRRIPWPEIGRGRLAAAWARVQAEHGAAGELLLVGVYGPLPLDAVTGLALDADGRAAVTIARRGTAGRYGDVALARVASTGRLVRSDVPRPLPGWDDRPLR